LTQKLTLKKQTEFLDVLSGGGTVKAGASKIGVSRQALYQARDGDERFRESWKLALEDGTPIYSKGEIVDTVYEYSDTLLIFLLKARDPKKYRENIKHEHSGPDDKPIAVRHEDAFDFTEYTELFRGFFQGVGTGEQVPNGHSPN
jgi:hypothetical protein